MTMPTCRGPSMPRGAPYRRGLGGFMAEWGAKMTEMPLYAGKRMGLIRCALVGRASATVSPLLTVSATSGHCLLSALLCTTWIGESMATKVSVAE